MLLRRVASATLLASLSTWSGASVGADITARAGHYSAFYRQESRISFTPARSAEFAAIKQTAHSACEAADPPQALTTPDPLMEPNSRVTVSFIIGVDGRVHSPLILESAVPAQERTVLTTVRSWRYRPATCNGVPTDAEAKIEFSIRRTLD